MTNSGEAAGPAPRGLRPEEVTLLADELRPLVMGARVEKVFDHGPHAFLLRLRKPGQKFFLLLTTRPGFSRFHLVEPSTAPSKPTAAAMELRELLGSGVLDELDQPGADRLIRLGFRVSRDGSKRERKLVLEMFGSQGRLVVYDGSTRRVLFRHGRGGAEVGGQYRFPDAPPRVDDRVLPPFEPQRLIPEEMRDDPVAFHRALAASMSEAEARATVDEARQKLSRQLHQDRKKRRRLLERLVRDEADAVKWEVNQQRGELLKAELGRLVRGQTKVDVVDYFDPALPQVEIKLDSKLGPAENVEVYFKKARKGRRGLEQIVERRRRCEEELGSIEMALEILAEDPGLEGLADGLAEAQRVASSVIEAGRSRRRGARSSRDRGGAARISPKEQALQGIRKYRSREGLEILSGRSARENDRLTLHVARGNDLFFHIARRPGPHVILRVQRGRNVAPESLEDAAFLAAYLSGWRGPGSIDVHWTEAKYVRKPRGLPPGKVEISREREYRVPYRPELLARLVTPGPTE